MMKKYLLFSGILLFVFILQSCNETVKHSEVNNSLSGYIINNNDEPVSDMEVSAIDTSNVKIASDTTDDEGFFVLKDLPDSLSYVSLLLRHKDYNYKIISVEDFINSKDNNNRFKLSEKFLEDTCCNFLKVNVKDEDGEYLDSVEVKLNKEKETIEKQYTNENGNVLFENLCDGNYWIRVYAEGYQVREIEFSLNECDTLEKNIELIMKDSCCNFLKFKITDNNGNKLKNSEIKLKKNGSIIGVKFTDENGIVEYENLCDGKYTYRIFKKDYEVIEGIVEIDDCEEKIIEKNLTLKNEDECCNSLDILVLDESEEALKNAEVRLNKGEKIISKQYTGTDGKVSFDSICDGTYWIRVYKDGYKVKEIEIGMDDCEELSKTIMLLSEDECCNSLDILVLDENEEALKNAEVRLNKGEKIISKQYTGTDGKVSFDSICDGTYWIRVYKDGYKVKEIEIGMDDCEEVSKTIMLMSEDECCNNILKVFPKDAESGEMITNAKVRLWKGGEKIEVAVSDENGAIIDGICKGKYWVDIIAEGYEDIEYEVEFNCEEVKEFTKELESD